jgi:short-subunit dehydrogenase
MRGTVRGMRRSLEGKVAVITGASSGIGAACAIEMARAGMDVALVARRADRLERMAGEVRALGRRAAPIIADVAAAGHEREVLGAAQRELGRVDVVFANAGYGQERPVLEMDDAELRAMFETNFFSSVSLLREAARRMIERQEGGHLLMCSSVVAKFALPRMGAYAASKAAQAMVCRAMRTELEPHGIAVSSVHPVTTRTEFFQESARRSGRQSTEQVPAHAPRLFVQPPERVARAVVACLRRPCPEVWTSHLVRLSAALFTAFPGLLDPVLRRTHAADTGDPATGA